LRFIDKRQAPHARQRIVFGVASHVESHNLMLNVSHALKPTRVDVHSVVNEFCNRDSHGTPLANTHLGRKSQGKQLHALNVNRFVDDNKREVRSRNNKTGNHAQPSVHEQWFRTGVACNNSNSQRRIDSVCK
jgi:hypothetical protein